MSFEEKCLNSLEPGKLPLSDGFHPKMIQTVKKYMQSNDKGYLLYMGKKFEHSNIKVIPYWEYM